MTELTMGSLFDGIGGFPLAAVRNGIRPLWASEIESFPIEVTKTHFPDMLHVGDITKLNGAELPPVDILCGGSPCQDLSIANGNRSGLQGARSGLFMEQIRLTKEMRDADILRGRTGQSVRPRYFCWENVPGCFSSGSLHGEDFRIVLEEIVRLSKYEKTLLFDEVVNGIEINNLYDMGGIKITCFDSENNVYANWGTNYNNYQFLFEQPWVQSSIRENGYVQWNMFAPSYVLEENGNVNYISLAKSLMSSSGGRRLATVIVSLEQKYLNQALKPFFCEPEDAVYICTEDGQIVLGLDGSGTFSEDDVAQVLHNVCSGGAGSSIVALAGRKELLSYYTLSRQFTFNGEVLKVLHLTSYAMLTSDVTRLQTQINTLMGVCVAVLIAVLIWLTNVLTRPIVVLSEKMLSYRMEDGVSGLDYARKDEIGRLNRSFRQMSDTICTLFEKQQAESEAREKYQYEALRAQVNPHFLFNTLNAIRWMAIIRKADNIVDCIDALATMLKYSMSRGGEMVTLKDELENINSYIYIYNCRYGNQFVLEIDLDDALLPLRVVKFILQPIVENAVIHGFKGSEKKGTILIYGDIEANILKLYVEDNGCGMQKEQSEEQARRKVTGIGIANVDARIKSAYGEQYGLRVYSGAVCGTVAEFTLPVLRGTEEKNAEDSSR